MFVDEMPAKSLIHRTLTDSPLVLEQMKGVHGGFPLSKDCIENSNCESASFLVLFQSINTLEAIVALFIGQLNSPLPILDFPRCVLAAGIRIRLSFRARCHRGMAQGVVGCSGCVDHVCKVLPIYVLWVPSSTSMGD